jgi:hypothetical protein
MQFLQIEHFAPHLNDTFQVDVGQGESAFVLVEVKPLQGAGPTTQGAVRAGFSLLFHNTAAIVFPQRIYAMRHRGLGEFGIFLVAIARDANGFIYQAIYN